MSCEIVEQKFLYGDSGTYGLAWCMYSAPVHREGSQCECSNSKGISLLSAVGKLRGGWMIFHFSMV